LEALKLLNTHKTLAICIPSHSSHLFNIGDVAVFAKMKASLKRKTTEFMREKGRNMLLQDFPYLFKQIWDECINQNAIISSKFY